MISDNLLSVENTCSNGQTRCSLSAKGEQWLLTASKKTNQTKWKPKLVTLRQLTWGMVSISAALAPQAVSNAPAAAAVERCDGLEKAHLNAGFNAGSHTSNHMGPIMIPTQLPESYFKWSLGSFHTTFPEYSMISVMLFGCQVSRLSVDCKKKSLCKFLHM